MAGKLFEYAILYHPQVKKDKDGNEIKQRSQVLTDVTRTLLQNETEAMILAARTIPSDYLDKLEQVEIVVRPF